MGKKYPDREYVAFISYRHKSPDKEIARIVQFLLEHNRVRPDRTQPRRIRPVFLDTSELPLSTDLNDDIREALDHSEHLYVICSPNLPFSKYCREEIRYFKEKNGGSLDRIHTLLVDGEPSESFIDLLLTTVRRTTLPDGTVVEQIVDAEPKAADVRGRNMLQRIWKLLTTEYVRLAAAYYRCPFDHLYKRHRRWRIRMVVTFLAICLAVAGGVRMYTDGMVANSAAIQAEEVLLQEDPLSALTVLADTQPGRTTRYKTALRSAVVQYDYQKNAQAIGSVLLNTYPESNADAYYISKDGKQIITHSSDANGQNGVLQITDLITGQIHLQEPQDRVFVVGKVPEKYLMLRSHEDEAGNMMDYVSVMDLTDNSLISEFAYRESSRESANYTLVQAIENKNLLLVWDGKEAVAFLTIDGQQLSEEEFVRIAVDSLDTPLPEEQTPYRLVRSRKKYLVKDASDQTVLELSNSDVSGFDFSDDWQQFAWVESGKLRVYDLQLGQQLAQVSWPAEEDSKLLLLDGSSYYAVMYLRDGGQFTDIYDWRSGEKLLSLGGIPVFSTQQQVFFLIQGGKLSRFHYRDLDLLNTAEVAAHTQAHTLAIGESTVCLLESETGAVVLREDTYNASATAWDETLDHILIRRQEDVACYGGDGTLLWTTPAEPEVMAVSADGSTVAWLQSGTVCLASAATGQLIDRIDESALAEAGSIRRLAVIAEGVCVAGEDGVVFPGKENRKAEAYSHITAYSDNLVVLSDEIARVRDFAVYDMTDGTLVYRPENNTEQWVYSAASGFLVRHVEQSGNNSTLQLEVLQKKNGTFRVKEQILLADNHLQRLHLDSTGRWLSVLCAGRTRVYDLKTMQLWLDSAGEMYYESGRIYGTTVFYDSQYCFGRLRPKELAEYTDQVLTSAWGKRTLTEEEKKLYAIRS